MQSGKSPPYVYMYPYLRKFQLIASAGVGRKRDDGEQIHVKSVTLNVKVNVRLVFAEVLMLFIKYTHTNTP